MNKERVEEALWLFVAVLEDGPRYLRDIVRTTGMDRRFIEDCYYELIQRGKVYVMIDSKLCLVAT